MPKYPLRIVETRRPAPGTPPHIWTDGSPAAGRTAQAPKQGRARWRFALQRRPASTRRPF